MCDTCSLTSIEGPSSCTHFASLRHANTVQAVRKASMQWEHTVADINDNNMTSTTSIG